MEVEHTFRMRTSTAVSEGRCNVGQLVDRERFVLPHTPSQRRLA